MIIVIIDKTTGTGTGILQLQVLHYTIIIMQISTKTRACFVGGGELENLIQNTMLVGET